MLCLEKCYIFKLVEMAKRLFMLLVFACIYVHSLSNLETCIKSCIATSKIEQIVKIKDLIKSEGDEIYDWFVEYECDYHNRKIFNEYVENTHMMFLETKKKYVLNNLFYLTVPKNNIFKPFDMFINYVGLKYECFLTKNSTVVLNSLFTCEFGVHQLYKNGYDHHVCQQINPSNLRCDISITDQNSDKQCVGISNVHGSIKSFERFRMERSGILHDDDDL